MAAPQTLKIDDVEYIRADSVKPQAPIGPIKIVVLDRGFVYVGETIIEGDFVKIKNAKNIRQWGTTKGLGELVKGPLSGTKLDEVGSLSAPLRALISIIEVEQEKWKLI